MSLIEIKNLTKDYGNGRGVFDISFTIEKGETFGFVGTNGSGKTTTIRHMMGFIKQDSGEVTIKGLDSWADAKELKKHIGYVPGEIYFPDAKNGIEFLKLQAEYLGIKDFTYTNKIIKKLQLDPTANLKRMSKGMKQKTAIISAFMADSEILILDEPTTGLDPLMRDGFLEILKKEKKKGKTIFMSTHIYSEVEDVCDRVGIIKDGRILDVVHMDRIKNNELKTFKIEFLNKKDYEKIKILDFFKIIREQENYNQITIEIHDDNVNKLLEKLKDSEIKYISEIKYSLEKYINELYKKEGRKNDK